MDYKPTEIPEPESKPEDGLDKTQSILQCAKERASAAWSFWSENYDLSDGDRSFASGDQWPEQVRQEREDDGRPLLTINRLQQFIRRVVNDMRQNRTDIKVHPVESDNQGEERSFMNVAGSRDYSGAELYQALIKNIEYNSNALSHYDRASDHMVQGGIAFLRVYTAYSRNDVFDLDLVIDSVLNPTSALIDPGATQPDWSDARYGFINNKMLRREFEAQYPNASPGSVLAEEDNMVGYWGDDEYVTVSEYICLEPETYMLYLMSDGQVWDGRMLKRYNAELVDQKTDPHTIDNPQNLTVTRQRMVDGHKVIWRLITANDILEGGEAGIEMPFSTLPLVPMFGSETIVENKRYFEGLVRQSKDAQRVYNYFQTAAVEMVALAPKSPYIVTPKNIENFETDWNEVHRKNLPYLPANPDPVSGWMPQRNPGMQANQGAELQQAMAASEDIKATMGIYDASLGNVSGEESGRAILARERQSDIGTYHYTDSRNKAIARVGKLLVEAIPKIYDAERQTRIRFNDETEDFIMLNSEIDLDGMEKTIVNDIGVGRYDVVVTSGPAYNTLRIEAVNTLMEFLQAVPNAGPVAMDLIAKNMDFPGAEELAERLGRMVPPNVKDDEAEMEEQPIPPEMQAQMQIEAAKAEQEQAKVMQQQGKTEEAKLKAMESQNTLSEEKLAALVPMLRELVLTAMAEVEADKQMRGMQ